MTEERRSRWKRWSESPRESGAFEHPDAKSRRGPAAPNADRPRRAGLGWRLRRGVRFLAGSLGPPWGEWAGRGAGGIQPRGEAAGKGGTRVPASRAPSNILREIPQGPCSTERGPAWEAGTWISPPCGHSASGVFQIRHLPLGSVTHQGGAVLLRASLCRAALRPPEGADPAESLPAFDGCERHLRHDRILATNPLSLQVPPAGRRDRLKGE